MTFYSMLDTLLNTVGAKAKRSGWENSYITKEYNEKTKNYSVMLHMKYSFEATYIKTLFMPLNEDLTSNDWEVKLG